MQWQVRHCLGHRDVSEHVQASFCYTGLDANCVVDVQMCSFDMGNRDETRLEVLAPMSVQSQLQWDDDLSAQLQVCACVSLHHVGPRPCFSKSWALGDAHECDCDVLRRQGMPSGCERRSLKCTPHADSRNTTGSHRHAEDCAISGQRIGVCVGAGQPRPCLHLHCVSWFGSRWTWPTGW